MTDLSNFHLLKEDNEYYHIGTKAGKKLSVKKKELHEKAHALVKKLPKYAEGGEVVPDSPELNITPPEGMYFDAASGQYLELPSPVATGRDAAAKYFQNDESAQLPNSPVQSGVFGQAVSGTGEPPVSGTQVAANAPDSKGDLTVPAPQASPQPQPQSTTNPSDMLGQKQNSVISALEAQKGFQEQIGQAEAGQAVAEAKQIEDTQKKINLMQTQEQLVNQYKASDDAFQKLLQSQKVDPNRYYNNLSTGQKVAQGIALVLGGIGAGLTGGPNQALNLIKDFIDKDIDAQKNDQSKTMNLWRMNRERLGNDLAANLATQNQLYTGLKYNLMKAASQYGGQAAQARAGMAASIIDQQIAQNRMTQSMIQIGLGQAGGQAQGADPAALVPHLVPPEKQQAVFDEIQNAQNIHREKAHLLEAFDAAAKDVRPFSGGKLRNAVVTSPYVKSFHLQVGPTISKLEKSVRDTIMQNIENNATPQFGDDDNTIAVKRKAFEHYMDSAASAPTAKGYGIDLSKFKSTSIDPRVNFTPQQMEYYNWAIQNKQDPKAQMVLKKLGVE